MRPFPADFLWGAATSSYQIEGAAREDGRGESIWDRFCRTPGKVLNGENGDVACDHYHRMPEDVALMKQLGLAAYRFSVAWPRVFPEGAGAVNEPGLAFYDRLVDTLLEAGIEPWLTLYHWDLPQALEDAGGWPSRDVVPRFVEYADAVSRRLGDRVSRWITLNEPWCSSMLGYQIGHHAPGRESMPDALAASHHLLLAHGRSVPVLRANAPGAEVGITLNFCPAEPASESPQDAAAARSFDGWFNRWFLDPICGGGYPADKLHEHFGGAIPPWLEQGDLEHIANPTDFLGVNYYNRAILRADESGNAPRTLFPNPDPTDMDWEVCAPALERLLLRLRDRYDGPLFITENGAAYSTGPGPDGRVPDVRRRDYFDGHLRACASAIDRGVDLRGYFAWSLMDNFEWAFGYERRFGLVWTDYDTQERIPKDSALWYRDVIARNGLED
jgi:beta-glucosidase